jgi:NADH:ubiquinone reductase (H+-translocating)
MPRPRVLIIGGGFGGLNAAKALRDAPVDVTLLDRTNHHVFQPLLYQVATAMLAPSDIAVPIRWILRHQQNVTVLLANVRAIDVENRVVHIDDQRDPLPYDYLIVAAGSRHAYFGHDEWESTAPGLKSLEDAFDIRGRFLNAFEEAEKSSDPAEQAAWQTFVIVGGGPTGVELAGMIPEVARRALRRDFRRIDTANTRVILVEGGSRVLPNFPEPLSVHAKNDLETLGVDVRVQQIVTRVEPGAVYIGDERIAARTIFWAAGNAASPLARSLGAPLDKVGRVLVQPDLSIPGHPEVFVIGDLARIEQDGRLVPGVAPAAMQEGRAAARNIKRTLTGSSRVAFRYQNKGDLATIGRNRAIADFGRFTVAGYFAWVLWLFIHIMYLVGFRNRVSVLLQWAYAYFTYQRGARLIIPAEKGVASAH